MFFRWTGNVLHPRFGKYKYTPLNRSERFPKRFVLVLLGFLGIINVYAMRVNLSVTMVAMVQQPTDPVDTKSSDIACKELIPRLEMVNNSSPSESKGDFDWDSSTQATILGSFFYGYVVTQIPGGILAEKYGAKWLFGIGVLVTSLFTLLTPLAAELGVSYLVFVRIMEGLGEGVTYPAMNVMIGHWAPKVERSRMSAVIYTGSAVGNVFSFALSGIISASIGWPSVFYIFGALGVIWTVFWLLFVYETPEKHPYISEEEIKVIRYGQDHKTWEKSPTPWKSILSSFSVWALVITHFGQNWGFYTLLTELPTYLSSILHFNIKKNGIVSSLPYMTQAVFAILGSCMADYLRKSGRFRINVIRKTFNSFDDFMRGRIIGKIEEGRKITDVAREFDIAHSVVSRLWKSFKTTGMCNRRHGGGRVRSTTPAKDRYMVLAAKRNRRTTAQQVANQLLAASGKQISRKTVARRLRGVGLYARRPVVCVPLTRQHRTARLQLCREHHNWTEQDWACVLFSDESRFSLSSDCRRQLIWRESGTAYRPENIQEKDRYPTCSIMVWAGIMINGRTRLHVVANGTMTGQ
ncbi:hypothetical protein TNCV_3287751 [Trichonephila clavipes]|nr:hypothetical protein TNCV_3287751 [Trichonephila clavipes]